MQRLESAQPKASIWVVDDHRSAALAVAEIARGAGSAARAFHSAEEAIDALQEADPPDVLVTDLRLPGADGMALLRAFKSASPSVGVVVMTAFGGVEDAVRAIQAGAIDFLTKPLSVERVEIVLRNAIDRSRLESELARVRLENRRLHGSTGRLVVVSRSMEAVVDQVQRAAASDATVLLSGESGTGKELLARLLHETSARRKGPFVAAHLAALAEGVLESELFGHERGAFTGALARHPGRFEKAEGGTLFLDEVAEIDPRTQVKLLRVLQERVVERVGGTESVPVDCRLVAATNKDLEAEVASGRFRSDLYYRLDVVRISVPPLRERRDDVPVLLAHFLDRSAARYGRPVPEVPPDVATALLGHVWPGNVRELENVAERLLVMSDGPLSVDDLPSRILARTPANPSLYPAGDVDLTAFLENLERELLRRALERSQRNKAQAARSLGLSREGLRYKLQKYGFDEN